MSTRRTRKAVAPVVTADARLETTNADDWRLGRAVPQKAEDKPEETPEETDDTPEETGTVTKE